MKKSYKLVEGSIHDNFMRSRSKVQIFGGGYANGKTTALVIKALSIAKDYPGANMLLARSTYPKLNDTLRKVFFMWCPKHWIKRFNKTENTVDLNNGTTINFRYIAQQGSDEHSSSNLLSATYDFIGVDQVEDPEIVHKDFLDLLGRLRGDARYIGEDRTMPRSGPRWVVLCCNPSRNWVYKQLIKPLHAFQKSGKRTEELLWDEDNNCPLIELFEGSTYENRDNLEPDFIRTLETAYTGQMRARFLLGKWAAYEGLIYPQFDVDTHVLSHELIMNYYMELQRQGYRPTIIEGYDYGLAVPSCYMWGFADHKNNVFIVDGFHEPEMLLDTQAKEIKRLRRENGLPFDSAVLADPSIFKRAAAQSNKTVGVSVAGMFSEYAIMMRRGNNDVLNGITKIQGYLNPKPMHKHPIHGYTNAPNLYVSEKLDFLITEFAEYYWKKINEANTDTPVDKNDHALDTLKYMLSDRPRIAVAIRNTSGTPGYLQWHDRDVASPDPRSCRYG